MHTHVELGPASCLAPALCCYGKRRGNQEMGGEKVTKPAQMNKSSRKNSSSETTEKNVCLILSSLFIINSPEGIIQKKHFSTMWPFKKTQFWGIAAAANSSLWMQLSVKQTPTYPCQRTISPLTAARLLQNRFTFCCPALLWPGKRLLSGKCDYNKQSSLSIAWSSRLLCFW